MLRIQLAIETWSRSCWLIWDQQNFESSELSRSQRTININYWRVLSNSRSHWVVLTSNTSVLCCFCFRNFHSFELLNLSGLMCSLHVWHELMSGKYRERMNWVESSEILVAPLKFHIFYSNQRPNVFSYNIRISWKRLEKSLYKLWKPPDSRNRNDMPRSEDNVSSLLLSWRRLPWKYARPHIDSKFRRCRRVFLWLWSQNLPSLQPSDSCSNPRTWSCQFWIDARWNTPANWWHSGRSFALSWVSVSGWRRRAKHP